MVRRAPSCCPNGGPGAATQDLSWGLQFYLDFRRTDWLHDYKPNTNGRLSVRGSFISKIVFHSGLPDDLVQQFLCAPRAASLLAVGTVCHIRSEQPDGLKSTLSGFNVIHHA